MCTNPNIKIKTNNPYITQSLNFGRVWSQPLGFITYRILKVNKCPISWTVKVQLTWPMERRMKYKNETITHSHKFQWDFMSLPPLVGYRIELSALPIC